MVTILLKQQLWKYVFSLSDNKQNFIICGVIYPKLYNLFNCASLNTNVPENSGSSVLADSLIYSLA